MLGSVVCCGPFFWPHRMLCSPKRSLRLWGKIIPRRVPFSSDLEDFFDFRDFCGVFSWLVKSRRDPRRTWKSSNYVGWPVQHSCVMLTCRAFARFVFRCPLYSAFLSCLRAARARLMFLSFAGRPGGDSSRPRRGGFGSRLREHDLLPRGLLPDGD